MRTADLICFKTAFSFCFVFPTEWIYLYIGHNNVGQILFEVRQCNITHVWSMNYAWCTLSIYSSIWFWCSSAYTEQFKTCSKCREIYTYDVYKIKSAYSNSCSITTLQGLEIEVVFKYNYLGFLIDDCLSFGPHIQYLVRKLKSKLGLFFRVKYYLSCSKEEIGSSYIFVSVGLL